MGLLPKAVVTIGAARSHLHRRRLGCRRRASSLPSLGLVTIVVAIAIARRGEREGKIRDWPRERGESKDALVGVLLAAAVGARHHCEDEPRVCNSVPFEATAIVDCH
ncbi:uncharacterized protein DS421_13g420830 [Arachis hypogaea]|nr:uncharacterized protein DS421_13g420830 [Arachis hypogaea]